MTKAERFSRPVSGLDERINDLCVAFDHARIPYNRLTRDALLQLASEMEEEPDIKAELSAPSTTLN